MASVEKFDREYTLYLLGELNHQVDLISVRVAENTKIKTYLKNSLDKVEEALMLAEEKTPKIESFEK